MLTCEECRKTFIVYETDVVEEPLACPHCQAEVSVPGEELD